VAIAPFCTVSAASPPPRCERSQVEKLSSRRPSSTWRWASQEVGATCVYHGHAVSLLWQS
jgi:hypothetical protein